MVKHEYQERTQIFALCTFFNNVGTILGGFLPLAVARFSDVRTGDKEVTFLVAIAVALCPLLALFAPERPNVLRGATAGLRDFWRGYRACLRNPLFRILLGTCFFINMGMWIGYAVGIYALIYWLGFSPSEIGFIYPVWLGTSCLALPFWTWLSGRIGKDVALRYMIVYGSALYVALYFLVPSKPLVYSITVFSGLGISGFVTMTSLLADVLDADELATGAQRAGAFLGFWSLALKIAAAVGPVLVGWILATVGYVPNAQQTPLVIETLRWLYGPIPGLFWIVSYFLFRNFSLSRQRVSEIQTELARRRTSVPVVSEVG